MRTCNVPAVVTTEQIIEKALKTMPTGTDPFRAPRGSKTIWAGKGRMRVRTPGERILYLPNGVAVKVTTDDSGIATQIEEVEALHAIARPKSIHLNALGGNR